MLHSYISSPAEVTHHFTAAMIASLLGSEVAVQEHEFLKCQRPSTFNSLRFPWVKDGPRNAQWRSLHALQFAADYQRESILL